VEARRRAAEAADDGRGVKLKIGLAGKNSVSPMLFESRVYAAIRHSRRYNTFEEGRNGSASGRIFNQKGKMYTGIEKGTKSRK
jgi:hypothetical protein